MRRNLIKNEEGLIGIILLLALVIGIIIFIAFVQMIGVLTFAGIMIMFLSFIVIVKMKTLKFTWYNPAVWLMVIGIVLIVIGFGLSMEVAYLDFSDFPTFKII